MTGKKEKIFGGIVAHHGVARGRIEQYFQQIASSDYEAVVLLGPNHFGIGTGEIQTSRVCYNTPSGRLDPESLIIAELVESGVSLLDGKTFGKEHSITTLVSYVKKYFPQAKLVPIILRHNVENYRCDKLADDLVKLLKNKKAVVLASVDFSHYLTEEMADFHDQVSISAINNFDYRKISEAELDSRPSIRVLLKYLSAHNAERMQLFSHCNSMDFPHRPEDNVVSYVFSTFILGGAIQEKIDAVLCLGKIDADCVENDSFSKIRRLFVGVDLVISETEKSLTKISNNSDCSCTVPAQILFENRIYPLSKEKIYKKEKLGEDAEYLTVDNINYLDSFLWEENYFIKQLCHGRLGCLLIDKSNGQELASWDKVIAKAKYKADYLMAYVFWPKQVSLEKIRKESQYLIDRGIDVVIGNYKEIISPEKYKDGLIIYSLGDFIVENFSGEKKSSLAVGLIFGAKKRHYFFPLGDVKSESRKK